MRVISGKYRSRPIKAPNPKFTRPTTDKVKESLFNMLQHRIDFESTLVLDIYAGSGSLGIEALSRGAKEVHFVEKNFSVYKVLIGNIKSLDAENQTKIWKQDAFKFTKSGEHDQYNLILADPPFFQDEIHYVFSNIIEKELLADDGIFIIERSIQTKEKDVAAFGIEPIKRMGDSLIYWYEK